MSFRADVIEDDFQAALAAAAIAVIAVVALLVLPLLVMPLPLLPLQVLPTLYHTIYDEHCNLEHLYLLHFL